MHLVSDIKIIEIGTNIKIKITVNGIDFYSFKNFETKEQAKDFLKEHGVKNS